MRFAFGGEQRRHRFQALLQTVARDLFEVAGGIKSFRHRELRQMQTGIVEFRLDPIGDPQRVLDRLRMRGEDAAHLVGTLDVEIVGVELHSALVAESLTGADAQKDFVREGVVLLEIVRVVRPHQLQPDLFAEAGHHRNDFLLIGNAVVLDLQEKILGAQDLFVLHSGLSRLGVIATREALRHFALQA